MLKGLFTLVHFGIETTAKLGVAAIVIAVHTVQKNSMHMKDSERYRMLGMRLAEARINQRMSQQRAADIVGVARLELVEWEEGRASPSAIQLGCIAMTYGVCAHALLFGSPWVPFDIEKLVKPLLVVQGGTPLNSRL